MIDIQKSKKVQSSGVSDFMQLEISKVFPNPNQPRKDFKDIEELANSIAKDGLIQPIAVTKKDDGYMIVSGERRYKAHLHLGLKTIKTHIITADDSRVQELALIENIQRDDLSDFEKAKYIGELWASGNYKQKQDLANAIGKSSSYISKAFSCLKLDAEIIKDLEEGVRVISLSVLEELSRIKDKPTQKEAYSKYLSGELVRDEIKAFKNGNKKDIISRVKKDTLRNCENCISFGKCEVLSLVHKFLADRTKSWSCSWHEFGGV